MKVLTFRQWRDKSMRQAARECDCSLKEASECFLTPKRWFEEHVQPAICDGLTLPSAVCRSLERHYAYGLYVYHKYYS